MAYPLIELVFAPEDKNGLDGSSNGWSNSRLIRSRSSIPERDDAEIVCLIRAGDETVFTEVVHDFAVVLQAYAYRYVRSADVAGDVVQDVFVRLWERRETLVVPGTLRQYIFVATRFRALELLRRDRMEGRHAERVAEQTVDVTAVGSSAQIEDELERLDRFIAVTRAVQELPPRQREIVKLRWVDGFTNVQTAARLGISIKGVEIQLTRALQTLRARLRES